MGKDNLIIGTARGKLGDVVFYRTGGEQRFRTRVRPANPRTNAQLIQRCVVSTVVKAYSDFITVCDHAFQNYVGKLKNHQRYMRLNIMAFRPVALAQVERWSPILWSYARRNYNWAKKDDVNTYVNPYIVSEGDLPSVGAVWRNSSTWGNNGVVGIPLIVSDGGDAVKQINAITYQEACDAWGLEAGDQLTFILQHADSTTGTVTRTSIARIILMPEDGDMSKNMFLSGTSNAYRLNDPNNANYGTLYFTNIQFGENMPGIAIADTIDDDNLRNLASFAVITSRFENNVWRRSSETMSVKTTFQKLSSLPDAVASYLKSDTSSLYLNQATTEERQQRELTNIELLSDETDMYGMTIAENAEKSSRRKK